MTEHENEQDESEEWIAGKHPVMEALRSGREINKIWIADRHRKIARTHYCRSKKSGNHRSVCGQT